MVDDQGDAGFEGQMPAAHSVSAVARVVVVMESPVG
jgi:hypothetical protein